MPRYRDGFPRPKREYHHGVWRIVWRYDGKKYAVSTTIEDENAISEIVAEAWARSLFAEGGTVNVRRENSDTSPFLISDLKIIPGKFFTKVQGQIKNNTGQSYSTALLKLSFFDPNRSLIDIVSIVINNFEDGEVVPFKETHSDPIDNWHSYKIRLSGYM